MLFPLCFPFNLGIAQKLTALASFVSGKHLNSSAGRRSGDRQQPTLTDCQSVCICLCLASLCGSTVVSMLAGHEVHSGKTPAAEGVAKPGSRHRSGYMNLQPATGQQQKPLLLGRSGVTLCGGS